MLIVATPPYDVTHMSESSHTCERVKSHEEIEKIAAGEQASERERNHERLGEQEIDIHTHTHAHTCHASERVMPRIRMSHVTHMNESCHISEWVMSHTDLTQSLMASSLSCAMTPVTHLNESRIWMSQASCATTPMSWLRLVGSIKLYVFFAKEPYKRDCILQKRLMILSSLLTVATPYHAEWVPSCIWVSHVTYLKASCHTDEWVMSQRPDTGLDGLEHAKRRV